MNRLDFEASLPKLAAVVPTWNNADAKAANVALIDALWRKWSPVPASTWSAIVARVVDSHARAGPPRPADFVAAENYLRSEGKFPSAGPGCPACSGRRLVYTRVVSIVNGREFDAMKSCPQCQAHVPTKLPDGYAEVSAPPTASDGHAEWCLEEVRTMKPAGARWVLARLDADPRLKLPDEVIRALLEKAGQDGVPAHEEQTQRAPAPPPSEPEALSGDAIPF